MERRFILYALVLVVALWAPAGLLASPPDAAGWAEGGAPVGDDDEPVGFSDPDRYGPPLKEEESVSVNTNHQGGTTTTTSTTKAAMAMTTGRGERAAEILATSANNHQASISSSVLPGNFSATTTTTGVVVVSNVTTATPTTSTAMTSSSTSEDTMDTAASSTIPVTITPPPTTAATSTTTTMVTTMAAIPHPSNVTVKDNDEVNVTLSTTVAELPVAKANSTADNTTTSHPSDNNNEEYPADYHGGVSTDDVGETTPVPEKVVTTSTSSAPTTTRMAGEPSAAAAAAANATTVRNSTTTRPSLLAAVGRALSQEENVPWPEAKSTKVIGTIIEDIHGPFNSGDSPSTSAADALNNGSIAAIVLCTFAILLATFGASGYWWYRRRYMLNRPETLSDRYAPSETAAGEDIFRVGYVHSPDLPRQDSSEEMYSLDNDSFLTSLEAMTIPTYWTETIKHTKL